MDKVSLKLCFECIEIFVLDDFSFSGNFPPAIWNLYNKSENLTNNKSEANNSRMAKMIGYYDYNTCEIFLLCYSRTQHPNANRLSARQNREMALAETNIQYLKVDSSLQQLKYPMSNCLILLTLN